VGVGVGVGLGVGVGVGVGGGAGIVATPVPPPPPQALTAAVVARRAAIFNARFFIVRSLSVEWILAYRTVARNAVKRRRSFAKERMKIGQSAN